MSYYSKDMSGFVYFVILAKKNFLDQYNIILLSSMMTLCCLYIPDVSSCSSEFSLPLQDLPPKTPQFIGGM